MHLPAFYSHAPRLLVRHPLAELLGAADDGLIEYGYPDAVRLAGHSCPTVAGAYLMTVKGMRALYASEMPERGNIEVLMSNGREEGVTGVIASVATLLTGAAAETGFVLAERTRCDVADVVAGQADVRERVVRQVAELVQGAAVGNPVLCDADRVHDRVLEVFGREIRLTGS